MLDHVLRIDRIFRQPQGHLLLIGVSGAGKTTLSRSITLHIIILHLVLIEIVLVLVIPLPTLPTRFVAWMNGLTVFQIKVHNKYSAEDFDEDLRQVQQDLFIFRFL